MDFFQFEEIVVPESFKIGNGVLGLGQRIYLHLVQFLSSSITREVLLNTFILFNFCFFFVTVHWN
jgi:hypothetical protein